MLNAKAPQWNGWNFSPTYLSTNLLSPLRTPYRETVPFSNIISGGTRCPYAKKDWGSPDCDYGGIGKLNDNWKRACGARFPRSHRHYISGLSKVLHDVVQPQEITTLLKSNCRQNDQFIEQPNHMINLRNMQEDNKFVQEPSYSSHISRNKPFPLSKIEEFHVLKLPEECLPQLPQIKICQNTIRELSKITKRNKVTSYQKDYEKEIVQACDDKPKEGQEACAEMSKNPLKSGNFNLSDQSEPSAKSKRKAGLWPCWPAGRSYIVSNVTGQIVEKRDVISLDDIRDFRIHSKLPRGKPCTDVKTSNLETSAEENLTRLDTETTPSDQNTKEKKEEICDLKDTENEKDNVKDEQEQIQEIGPFQRTFIQRKYLRKWYRFYEQSRSSATKTPDNNSCQHQEEDQELPKKELTGRMREISRAETTVKLLLTSLEKNSNKKETTNEISRCPKRYSCHDIVQLYLEPLHKCLTYPGNRIADRLGVRFKTVAYKRYHRMHPDPIPDLRDWRPPVRKSFFLGYHTSTFR